MFRCRFGTWIESCCDILRHFWDISGTFRSRRRVKPGTGRRVAGSRDRPGRGNGMAHKEMLDTRQQGWQWGSVSNFGGWVSVLGSAAQRQRRYGLPPPPTQGRLCARNCRWLLGQASVLNTGYFQRNGGREGFAPLFALEGGFYGGLGPRLRGDDGGECISVSGSWESRSVDPWYAGIGWCWTYAVFKTFLKYGGCAES